MKLIVLLGQTCSGKSQMAVDLAKHLDNAWVVNCDSRQIYKRLNLGTAKVEGAWKEWFDLGQVFVFQDIPHFLIDFVDPKKRYSLADYLKDWVRLFEKHRSLLPEYVILTGGTGLFAKAICEEYDLTQIKPECEESFEDLRASLSTLSLRELQDRLSYDCQINESDWQNSRRLVNKILTAEAKTGGWLEELALDYPRFSSQALFAIGIDQDLLQDRIKLRVDERVEMGLLDEVNNLQDLGTARVLELGLEYRLSQLFLLGQLSERDWREKLYQENFRYAKRQMTWLKKQPVTWVHSLDNLISCLDL